MRTGIPKDRKGNSVTKAERRAIFTFLRDLTIPFTEMVDRMAELGRANGLDIRTMHEDIFNSMHRI